MRALGIRSVAGGVESPDAAAALAAIGCDAAQGRYYCGPLDPAAATTWLAGHLRPAAARPSAAARTRRGRGSRAASGSPRRCGPPRPTGSALGAGYPVGSGRTGP